MSNFDSISFCFASRLKWHSGHAVIMQLAPASFALSRIFLESSSMTSSVVIPSVAPQHLVLP